MKAMKKIKIHHRCSVAEMMMNLYPSKCSEAKCRRATTTPQANNKPQAPQQWNIAKCKKNFFHVQK